KPRIATSLTPAASIFFRTEPMADGLNRPDKGQRISGTVRFGNNQREAADALEIRTAKPPLGRQRSSIDRRLH
ncbi:MAG: hypothetical protein ACKVHO_23275, partial [Verrucomicrobiia bacterium]